MGFPRYPGITPYLNPMAARGDLIRKLFRSFSENDREEFYAAAMELIEEERSKNHLLLAKDLEKSLQITPAPAKAASNSWRHQSYPEVPKARDTGLPLITVKPYDLTWENVILSETNREILETVVAENRKRDILTAYNLKPRCNLLFCGPPGCGKTLTARVIAGILFLPLVSVNLAAVFSSYLGETAVNLKMIFEYLEKGEWVVLFDEFDAIAKDRNAASEHGEIKRIVNSLLQLIDGLNQNSIFIAATNHPSLLDPAIWRRFDEVILFDKPDESLRKLLLRKNLASIRHELDLEGFARHLEGATGADIERICANAIKSVILRNEKVLKDGDLTRAIGYYRERMDIVVAARQNPQTVWGESDD
ncbi:MAG: ATP-binding protein [Oscillatoriaceae cyanobacterium]